jgi:hypothetical protein
MNGRQGRPACQIPPSRPTVSKLNDCLKCCGVYRERRAHEVHDANLILLSQVNHASRVQEECKERHMQHQLKLSLGLHCAQLSCSPSPVPGVPSGKVAGLSPSAVGMRKTSVTTPSYDPIRCLMWAKLLPGHHHRGWKAGWLLHGVPLRLLHVAMYASNQHVPSGKLQSQMPAHLLCEGVLLRPAGQLLWYLESRMGLKMPPRYHATKVILFSRSSGPVT